jgi:hypothetical protein
MAGGWRYSDNPYQQRGTQPVEQQEILLPQRRAIVRHCVRLLLETSVAPFGVFYTLLRVFGLRWALGGALGLSLGMLARRIRRGRRVPAMLVFSAVFLMERALVGFLTKSTFLYFVQPAFGTLAIGLAFAISALVGRPLIERVVRDFCPLPIGFGDAPCVARAFLAVSMVFAGIHALNAGGTAFLLTQSSLGAFLVLKSLLSPVLMAGGVVLSYGLFRRTLRHNGITLRWTKHGD